MIRITHLMRVSDGPPVRWVGKTDQDEEIVLSFDFGAMTVTLDAVHYETVEVTFFGTRDCEDWVLPYRLPDKRYELPDVIDQAITR